MADLESTSDDTEQLTSVSDEEGGSHLSLSSDWTESLKSSLRQYPTENGRTYHAMESGKYVLPNDELEQDRLEILAEIWMLSMKGRHCICPKNDSARTVLDMGTGTGNWAISYADEHSETEVLGVDLSPIQPTSIPPNCTFEVDDLEKPWTWGKGTFDLVVGRCTSGCFKNTRGVIAEAYDRLQPGGYLELQDHLFPALSDDGSLASDSALVQWCNLLSEGSRLLGHPFDEVAHYQDWLAEAGFVDVKYTTMKWPINAWPAKTTSSGGGGNHRQREIGLLVRQAFDMGIEGLCMATFTRALGWTPERTLELCERVRKEVGDTEIHGYWNIVVIYGRKPGDNNTTTTTSASAAPPVAGPSQQYSGRKSASSMCSLF